MNEYLISPQELKQKLDNNEAVQLIDVRTLDKHQSFNIGGKWLPFAELAERMNELDPEIPIVAYCTSGNRSMMALELLLQSGFTLVQSLDGGMTVWQQLFGNGAMS